MSQTPKRRLLDHVGASPTCIAEGSRLIGDLETRGPLLVCGTVQGNASIAGALHLVAGASWLGDIHAQQAVIAGRVTGRIFVAEKLEIGASARIEGEVSARSIAIARGAVIEGNVSVSSDQPVVTFDERRRDS